MDNKTRPLNYCRQIKKYLRNAETDKKALAFRNILARCVKFTLPEGGYFIEDSSLKGLDSEVGLNLPFKEIALEYETKYDDGIVDKKVILAIQPIPGAEINILLWSTCGTPNGWRVCKTPLAIQCVSRSDGTTEIKSIFTPEDPNSSIEKEEMRSLYCNEAWVLTSFLNTLACSNIKIEKLERRKPLKGKKNGCATF